MTIRDYIADCAKVYRLRLKTLLPLDDAAMDAVELAVARYQPLELSRPKKAIIQRFPADFEDAAAGEVTTVDMAFALPVTPSVLRDVVRTALRAPERAVVVRTPFEATEAEGERQEAAAGLEALRVRDGVAPAALLDNPGYPELAGFSADDLAGPAYNARLLDYLDRVQDEDRERRARAANLPFNWLGLPDRESQQPRENGQRLSPAQDASDFNKDVPGAMPQPTGRTRGIRRGTVPPPPGSPATGLGAHRTYGLRALSGTVDERRPVTRLYKDKDGNRIAASALAGDAPRAARAPAP